MAGTITIRTAKTAHNVAGANTNRFALQKPFSEDPQKALQRLQRKYNLSEKVIRANLSRCKWCTVSKSCDFSFVSQEWQNVWAIHRLMEYGANQPIVISTYEKNMPVTRKAEEVLVICDGEVKVNRIGIDGSESLRRIGKKGNMIMDVDFFAGGSDDRNWGEGPVVEDVRTIKDTCIAHIPGDVFAVLVRNNYALFERKITQMARAALFSANDSHSAMHLGAKQKIARALNILKSDDNTVQVKLKDIAASAGISKETACRVIKEFKEKGYVKKEKGNRKIILTDEFFKSPLFNQIKNA